MKKVLIILVSLILVLIALLILWQQTMSDQDGINIISGQDEKVIPYTRFEKMKKTAFSTARGDEYSGFRLLDILQNFNPQDIDYLILHSADSGSLRLNKTDHSNAYFIWMTDSVKPSLRLIISTDQFGQRWLKYLKSIEIHYQNAADK